MIKQRSILSLSANTASNMTSPSHSFLGLSASAERSSGRGAPTPDWGSPVSSGYVPLGNYLFNGSAFILGTELPVASKLPAPRIQIELPDFLKAECAEGSRSPLLQRTSPPIEHGSLKSYCDPGILQPLPSITKSSTEVHASHRHAPKRKRASSRARAIASDEYRRVSHAHGFHAGRQTSGRSYKDPLRPSDPRVHSEGEAAISATSANPRTAALEGAQARPPFQTDSRDDTGASVPNSLSVVAPSPSSSACEFCDSHLLTGPLSAHLRNSISSSLSSTALTPWSSIEPSPSATSFGSLYGSPGAPIPRPYPILPTPNALVSQQDAPQPSAEADGYTIIRNAVSPALVREVVASIYKSLPVTATFETEKIYTMPNSAYKVRDEFVLVCHLPYFQLWS